MKVFETKDVTNFDCRNETKSEKESEDSADRSNKSDLRDLLLRDVLGDVGILDVDADLRQVLPGVIVNLLL
jgi:hypothetical protein